ncbi:hypothetical protein GNI_145870 [Gregarina niphandrodes]|uniref:Uncharacterized protein n=1 Tax=Gregarina niphandrodes TaxID=110365 RepID=A0A023B0A8_GRENI|nr:hypothetical protein GNI_145870 [Gregarina niphandrodes]EZG44588.1 hypothetical protein GNI_145870 [Gregarina niphandrodes]|eukprot:XP_011134154.1 hypothetical protein GNI_145870 [Gregarina niphandrodes]
MSQKTFELELTQTRTSTSDSPISGQSSAVPSLREVLVSWPLGNGGIIYPSRDINKMRTCVSQGLDDLTVPEGLLSFVQKVLCQVGFGQLPDSTLLELVPLNSVRRLKNGMEWRLPVEPTTAGELRALGMACDIMPAELCTGQTSSVWMEASSDLEHNWGDRRLDSMVDFQRMLRLCRDNNVFLAGQEMYEARLRAYWGKYCQRPGHFWRALRHLDSARSNPTSRERVRWYRKAVGRFHSAGPSLALADAARSGEFTKIFAPGEVLLALQPQPLGTLSPAPAPGPTRGAWAHKPWGQSTWTQSTWAQKTRAPRSWVPSGSRAVPGSWLASGPTARRSWSAGQGGSRHRWTAAASSNRSTRYQWTAPEQTKEAANQTTLETVSAEITSEPVAKRARTA